LIVIGNDLSAATDLVRRFKNAKVLGVDVLEMKPSLSDLACLKSPCLNYTLDGEVLCFSGYEPSGKRSSKNLISSCIVPYIRSVIRH